MFSLKGNYIAPLIDAIGRASSCSARKSIILVSWMSAIPEIVSAYIKGFEQDFLN